MLNDKQATVLDVIGNLCGEPDVFKIIEADEIISNFPKDFALGKPELSTVIKELKELDLVKVKYFTTDEYCLSASPKAKLESEKREEEYKVEAAIASGIISPVIRETKSGKKKIIVKNTGFWGAFLGALLGGGVIFAIGEILRYFVF